MENLRNALHKILLRVKLRSVPSNMNMSTYREELREIKLEVLLFCHFMYEDDNRLSLREKATIVDLIKEEVESLPEKTQHLFESWMDNPPSLGYILDYAKENGYSYDDLDDAIRAFVEHTNAKSKYHPVIRDVRKKLILEKDFLKK